MDTKSFYAYWVAIDELEAQEDLRASRNVCMPNLKDNVRKDRFDRLTKVAKRTSDRTLNKGKPLTPGEIMASINGVLNGQ